MIASRVNPINVDPSATADATKHLVRPVQSTTIGVRIGEKESVNIGYVQKFSWDQSRPSSEVYQIEPCVDGTFSKATKAVLTDGSISFYVSNYVPGEVIEVIPGKAGPASITLSRAVLYGSNLMSALMYVENAGIESLDLGVENNALVFGGNAMQYVSLIQQVRPIFIKQVVYNPVKGDIIWGRVFEGAWIEDWGEEMPDASKNEIVVETMKIKAAKIRPLNEPSGTASEAEGATTLGTIEGAKTPAK